MFRIANVQKFFAAIKDTRDKKLDIADARRADRLRDTAWHREIALVHEVKDVVTLERMIKMREVALQRE